MVVPTTAEAWLFLLEGAAPENLTGAQVSLATSKTLRSWKQVSPSPVPPKRYRDLPTTDMEWPSLALGTAPFWAIFFQAGVPATVHTGAESNRERERKTVRICQARQ